MKEKIWRQKLFVFAVVRFHKKIDINDDGDADVDIH